MSRFRKLTHTIWHCERADSVPSLEAFSGFEKAAILGDHFWTKGYCVDTVGLDEDKIRQYVKYQEDKERREEQMKFGF